MDDKNNALQHDVKLIYLVSGQMCVGIEESDHFVNVLKIDVYNGQLKINPFWSPIINTPAPYIEMAHVVSSIPASIKVVQSYIEVLKDTLSKLKEHIVAEKDITSNEDKNGPDSDN